MFRIMNCYYVDPLPALEDANIVMWYHYLRGSVVTHTHCRTVARIFSRYSSMSSSQKGWQVPVAREAENTINPIRHCSEIHYMDAISRCKKEELFKVNIGDPAVFGNLPPHPAVNEALREAATNMAYNGLTVSTGLPETKRCVAEQLSKYPGPLPITEKDVFMTCGSQGALEVCLRVLCEPGAAVLLPRPCYPFYKCQGDGMGLTLRFYKLLPERGWEADLEDLDRQLGGGVSALIVNNPSNPCGSVYSKQHLLDILALAEKHKVPIIADEIYADMVFEGEEFHPIGRLSQNVPVLSCGGISKRFLVPGWRCGWVAVHDHQDILGKKPCNCTFFLDINVMRAIEQDENGMRRNRKREDKNWS